MGIIKLSKGATKNVVKTTEGQEVELNKSETNAGGNILKGAGYVLGNLGLGAAGIGEGIWDYVAGGLADLFGADEWAEEQFANNWTAQQQEKLQNWYNPDETMKFVGDIAGGIGNSLVGAAAVAGASVISGGTLAPAAAALVAGGTIGLGAAGMSTSEAYAKTGELGAKEYGYGALSGGLEAGLETVTGAAGKVGAKLFAKQTAKTIANKAVSKGLIKTVVKEGVKDFAGEAFEESVSEFINPYLERWTKVDPEAKNATFEEIAYAGLVGGVSGFLMSGASTTIKAGQYVKRGNDIINKGYESDVLNTARELSKYSTDNNVTKKAYSNVTELLNRYEAIKDTKSTERKRILGELQEANVALIFEPEVSSTIRKMQANSSAYADAINNAKIPVGNGKYLTVTEEDIKNVSPVVMRIAVSDALGKLYLDDTQAVTDRALSGNYEGISQASFRNFQMNATAEQKQAISNVIGVDVDKMSYEEFIGKIPEITKERQARKTQFDTLLNARKAIDGDGVTFADLDSNAQIKDGENAFNVNGRKIVINKDGDGYYIYDGENRRISKTLSEAELKKTLKDEYGVDVSSLSEEKIETAKDGTTEEMSVDRTGRERKTSKDDVLSFIEKNVKNYENLTQAKKLEVQNLVRSAKDSGVDDSTIKALCEISATSDINFAFIDSDVNGFFVAPSGTIYISNTAENINATVIHEMVHAFKSKNVDTYNALENLALKDVQKNTKKYDKIRNTYEKFYNENGMKLTDSILNEEFTAHYIENMLGSSKVLSEVSAENKGIFRRIMVWLKKRVTMLKGTSVEKDVRKLSDLFEKAVKEYSGAESKKSTGDKKYSLYGIEQPEDIRYSLPDKQTQDILEKGKTITVYRAMQIIDGKLYPPMAARVKNIDGSRELVMSSELGRWEQADERPELIRKGNKFTLDKANGSSIEAAYNPYFHTSRSPLNDQFSSAYKRDNLVIVEGEVPASELTSGYRAQYAKDTVGEMKWHSGPVSSKLPKGKERKVILSRWFKPIRIVPNAEAAQIIADMLKGENIDIPYNTVTPSLLKELEKRGVSINYKDKGIRYSLPETDSEGNALSAEQREFFKDSKVVDDQGRLLRAYHGTNVYKEITVFKRGKYGYLGGGIYLTDDKNYAKRYADKNGYEGKIYDVYVNAKNPLVVRSESPAREILKAIYGTDKIYENRAKKQSYETRLVTSSDIKKLQNMGYDAIMWNYADSIELSVFNSEQIKLASNKKPTISSDIRYSVKIGKDTVSGAMQSENNLVALHNLSETNLKKVIQLGGFPMPSIAITKDSIPHENYGTVTVVFGKETIDPEADYRNIVYDKDAWTPTKPKTDVKLNNKKVDSLIENLESKVENVYAYKSDIDRFFDGNFRNNSGEYVMSDYDYSKDVIGNKAIGYAGVVASYLSDKGINIDPVYAESGFTVGWSSYTREEARELLESVGITKGMTVSNATEEQRKNILEKYIKYKAKTRFRFYQRRMPNISESDILDMFRKETDDGNVSQLLFMAEDFFNENRPKDIYDSGATLSKMLSKVTDKDDFYSWIWDKISSTFEKKGIDNDSDIFDRRGNRRSFEQRHYSYNLQNIVKVMSKGEQEGKTTFGITAGALAAKLSTQFDSIEDIRKAKDFLSLVSEDEMEAFNNKTYELYDEIVGEIAGKSSDFMTDSMRRDDIGDVLGKCASVNPLNVEGIKRKFISETKGYNLNYKFNDKIAQKVLTLFELLKRVPTTYFEAKPRRAVGLNEIKTVILPANAEKSLIDMLKSKDIAYKIVKEGESRTSIIQNMDDIKFSVKDDGRSVGGLTKGQRAKFVANNTGKKVYSRSEAANVINSILNDRLVFEDKFMYGEIKVKEREEITDYLFEKLNSTKEGYRIGVAQKIADYFIDKAVMTDMFAGNDYRDEALRILSVLRGYMHKINLNGIQDEIKSRYDKNNRINQVWGKKSGGIAPDTLPSLLEYEGIFIDATTAAESFFEMLDLYDRSKEEVNKKVEKAKLSSFGDEETLNRLRNQIVRDVLTAYDEAGEKSKFATRMEKYVDKAGFWKNKYYDERKRAKAINSLFESVDRVKGLEKYKRADVELAEEVLGLVKLLKGIKTYRGNLSKHVREIMTAYSKTVNGQKLYEILSDNIEGEKNPFADDIEAIAKANGELTTDEIIALDKILQNFIHNVNNYSRVFFEGKAQQAADVSERGIIETREVPKVTDRGIFGALNKAKFAMQSPVWRFERLGGYVENSVMSKLFKEFQNGFSKQAAFEMKAAELFKEFFKKHAKEFNKWREQNIELKSVPGVKFSRTQLLDLYLLDKREQAKTHLYNGEDGISGVIRLTNNKSAQKNGTRAAETDGRDVTISIDTVSEIEDMLTDTDREFISLVEKFFKLSRDAKVETDNALYGVSNVEEGFYIPIRVANDQIYKKIGDGEAKFADLFNIYSPSFNKEVKPNAKNKIVIEDVFDVINRHSRQMAVYYGLSQPVKTFNKIYNYKNDLGESLRAELQKVDSSFEDYVGRLINDMQGNTKVKTGIPRALSKIRGWSAKAALAANLKVLTTQFVSLPAAAAVGFKYQNLAKGFALTVARKTNVDAMFKYMPMLYDRFRNGNNIDVGLLREGQGIIGKLDWLTDLATAPIGKVDAFVCMSVWNAAVEQTKSSSYANYSEEHYKKAAELAESALIKTQANYTSLYRPEILRSQDSLVQSLTMFMSEPLQQFSLLTSSVEKMIVTRKMYKNATGAKKAEYLKLFKKSRREAIRAMSAVLIDTILLTAITQLFKWVKGQQPEEDKRVEDIISDFFENYIGMFPIVKDIYNYIVNGYDITGMEYTGITNIVDGVTGLTSAIDLIASGGAYDETTVRQKFRKVLLGVTQTMGIPLRNLETYTKGILEKIVPEKIYRYNNLFYNENVSQYSKDFENAIKKGDNKLADTILSIMFEEKNIAITDEKVLKAIKDLKIAGYDVSPRSINETITYNNEEIAMTKKQQDEFKSIYSEANDVISKMVSSTQFKSLSQKMQADAINEVYDMYYDKGLENLLNEEISDKNLLFSNAVSPDLLAMVYSFSKNTSSQTDKEGNAIAGSKKKEVLRYVNSLNISKLEKAFLISYLGYSIGDNDIAGLSSKQAKTAVVRYINGKGLPLKEKLSIAEYCGLTVKNGRILII